MTKEINIEIPQGLIIDTDKTSFNLEDRVIKIVFKDIEDEFVDSWEDLKKVSGYKIQYNSTLQTTTGYETFYDNKNIFPTKQDAESALALAQLLQLRKRVIGDWEADWNNELIEKYCIHRSANRAVKTCSPIHFHELSFPTAEMRDKFLEKYRDLIEIYFKLK